MIKGGTKINQKKKIKKNRTNWILNEFVVFLQLADEEWLAPSLLV